jgi:rhamnose utilization protein RhaD (predicted bifunctional aldolase and dehydrogenase)
MTMETHSPETSRQTPLLLERLVELSHFLGAEHRNLAILGEGNTSAKQDAETFWVKASGSSLGSLKSSDLVQCRFEPLLALLEQSEPSDAQVDRALTECRVDAGARRPSVEAMFHAYLLSLPGVQFVGHTHSTAVNTILCSPRARDFAQRRIFPDEVVCCGCESVLVPYCDPGIWLAQAIRTGVEEFQAKRGNLPRVILLESHGIVTFGAGPEAVKASMAMAVKAAEIFLGASALGGPVFLPDAVVNRIASRSDEHYRQKALNL